MNKRRYNQKQQNHTPQQGSILLENIFLFSPSRRGMGVSEVFVFIVAGLTFALIAIFGYKAITDFVSAGEDVQFAQFKTSLETDVKTISTEYRKITVRSYTLPTVYTSICFVDMDLPGVDVDQLCLQNPAACVTYAEAQKGYPGSTENIRGTDAVSENVFLSPVAGIPLKLSHFRIYEGSLQKGFHCDDLVGGQFSLTLEGGGDHAIIHVVKDET